MNQVPEIKEGLQFRVLKEEGINSDSRVFTIVDVNPTTSRVRVIANPQDHGAPWGKDVALDNFQRGIWVPVPTLSTLFSSQPHNVVMTALEECAKDYFSQQEGQWWPEDSNIPSFLSSTDGKSVVETIVDKIHQLGFTIIPK